MTKINNNSLSANHARFALSNKKDKKVVAEEKASSDHLPGKPNLKEVASEAIPKAPLLGEFKDKKGLDQTTDLHIGPDIRYALTSRNVDFLKRILWGPLTVGEYREVQYRIRELESSYVRSNNILSGKLMDIT